MSSMIALEDREVIPLGTADWSRAGDGAVRPYQHGDFWLGYSEDGEAVGFDDRKHIDVVASTRGGKGVSVIVPNLCLWPGSVCVIDPKSENAMVTARRRGRGSRWSRGMGQSVRILDPFDAVCRPDDDFADVKACFNPLDLIDADKPESVDEAGRIADALVVTEASNDPFWEESARYLVKCTCLHVATSDDFTDEERNLVTVQRLVDAGDMKAWKLALLRAKGREDKTPSPHVLLFMAMRQNPAFGGVLANAGQKLLNLERKGEKMLQSIAQIASTNLEFIDSPGMKRVLSKSDFRLSELKTARNGMSLFISLPQRYMETHYRWLRMMVTLTITEMERIATPPAIGHPVLMVLDEFAALRRMRVLENAAAQIAGFGVKLCFVVQTLPQLKEHYKDNWETLLANAGVKLFFCNDDHFSREYASKLVGDREIIRTVRNHGKTKGWSSTFTSSIGTNYSSGVGPGGGSSSSGSSGGSSTSDGYSGGESGGLTETIQKRALVNPDEVGRLFGNMNRPTALGLMSGHQPVFLKRRFYYEDERFAGLFDPHPLHPPPPTLLEHEINRVLDEDRRRRKRQARRDAVWWMVRTIAWRRSVARNEERRVLRCERMILAALWSGMAAMMAGIIVIPLLLAKWEARAKAAPSPVSYSFQLQPAGSRDRAVRDGPDARTTARRCLQVPCW